MSNNNNNKSEVEKKLLEESNIKIRRINIDPNPKSIERIKNTNVCFYCVYWCPAIVDRKTNRFSHFGLCEDYKGTHKKLLTNFTNTCSNFKKWIEETETEIEKEKGRLYT